MSWFSQGSQCPVADIPDVRNDNFAVTKEMDTGSQAPLSASLVDSTLCRPCSSAATPPVTSDLNSVASFQSAPDECTTFDGNSRALSLTNNPSNRNESASQDGGPISEIQNIMEQFDKDGERFVGQDDRSPRFTVQIPFLDTSINHPPRKSSLEPLHTAPDFSNKTPSSLPKSSSINNISQIPNKWAAGAGHDTPSPQDGGGSVRTLKSENNNIFSSPGPGSVSSQAVTPLEPNSEPDLSFDFHRFLEQLRHRTADPVAKFLRSFLVEFGKKKWMAHEQGKIISDFLAFIANKMASCEIWRGLSDIEFDNAKEGMEKLVMNRLYSQTFSPAIPSPVPAPTGKIKQKTLDRLLERGRTGQHQEDIERDEILSQKVRIYGWVREEHLDILSVGESGLRFLTLAQKGM